MILSAAPVVQNAFYYTPFSVFLYFLTSVLVHGIFNINYKQYYIRSKHWQSRKEKFKSKPDCC